MSSRAAEDRDARERTPQSACEGPATALAAVNVIEITGRLGDVGGSLTYDFWSEERSD
jgi:hypothetical protein